MTEHTTISPHILAHSDGRVLTLPDGDERRVIAVFSSESIASAMAPSGFEPVYCGAEDLPALSESLHIWLIGLLGLPDDLDGSILPVDNFVGVLLEELP